MTRTEWLASVGSGARVAVVEAPDGIPSDRIIHYGMTRKTPKGHLYLLSPFDDRDWRYGFRRDPPRAIVPVGPDGKIINLGT